ncbi:unnamed protein product [Nyctereutes procyonoides]|uniref:(raccoon dog) hypothetical protein n=1 Tax=Nyctereutes procyonoides TaxID=34880 RepID=A0A811ZKJ2_NYCPR|nr:unnamed protein product [Nyctereutes procyonoides]
MKDGAAAPGEDMDVRSLEPSGEIGSPEGETTLPWTPPLPVAECFLKNTGFALETAPLSGLFGLCFSFFRLADCTKMQYEDPQAEVIYRGGASPDLANAHVLGPEPLLNLQAFSLKKKKKRHVYREFLIHKHNLHTPFPIFSSSGILQKETWQGRIVYNQSQKDILQEWFKQNPYPDKAARKQWAKEIGIPIWFKNHRAKQRPLEFGCSFGKNKTQGQHQYQPWTQEYLPKAARQDWTPITRSQSHTLVQAFERNQFPDITTRKKLAKKMGIQEPRIQMWFQNQRSLYPGQSRSESMNSLADGPNGRSGLTAQQHQINQPTLLGRSHHFSSSNSFSRNQTFLPASLPSHDSSVPCLSQRPSVMMVLPTQRENSVSILSLRNYLPMPSTLGGDLSDTQTLFCWKDYSQPHPEDQKHQLQDLEQVNISYILQRWDNVCQALIAKWDPGEGTH